MIHRMRTLRCLLAIGATLLCGQSELRAQNGAGGSGPKYDGSWWGSVHADEKQGFVVGHEDCFVWEGRHTRAKGYADKELVKAIDFFFRDPSHRIYSVPRAMDLIAGSAPWNRAEPKPQSKSGGETWTEPHWYLDGTWWRGGNDKEHLGYVEGYLACVAGLAKLRLAKELPPPQYVKAIDLFYGRKPKNESEKAGVVLMKVVAPERN